jgi:hypothetical protein
MVLRFALFGLIGLHECVAIEWLQDYLYGDRASADSADTKVFRNIYESEEWSRSWCAQTHLIVHIFPGSSIRFRAFRVHDFRTKQSRMNLECPKSQA